MGRGLLGGRRGLVSGKGSLPAAERAIQGRLRGRRDGVAGVEDEGFCGRDAAAQPDGAPEPWRSRRRRRKRPRPRRRRPRKRRRPLAPPPPLDEGVRTAKPPAAPKDDGRPFAVGELVADADAPQHALEVGRSWRRHTPRHRDAGAWRGQR